MSILLILRDGISLVAFKTVHELEQKIAKDPRKIILSLQGPSLFAFSRIFRAVRLHRLLMCTSPIRNSTMIYFRRCE